MLAACDDWLPRARTVQAILITVLEGPKIEAEETDEVRVRVATRGGMIAPAVTLYPDDDAASYVADALTAGTTVFKVHLVVGGYDPWHPSLREVWAQIERAGVSVVIHAGAYPDPTPWTGARGRSRGYESVRPWRHHPYRRVGARVLMTPT